MLEEPTRRVTSRTGKVCAAAKTLCVGGTEGRGEWPGVDGVGCSAAGPQRAWRGSEWQRRPAQGKEC